jgi:two-component system response regulator GlrR
MDTGDQGRFRDPEVPSSPALEAACITLGLVGQSPAFRAALALAAQWASSQAPVLIHGPTGNGKELFARLVHYLGGRREQPFIPVNCAALPDTLVESELFGHARGAFTDARNERAGLVALAAGGTLFLDELDSLSPKAQAALLRFVQDREFRPVGGRAPVRADVRLVTATNADLAAAVAHGAFRQDLLFRLDVLGIELPSLADRREDIPLLARFFVNRFATLYRRPAPTLKPEALAFLAAQDWPGNVRELENRMHRAFVLAADGAIGPRELGGAGAPFPVGEPPGALYGGGFRAARARETIAFETRYLRELMTATGGNVTEAARRAGLERRAMGKLLKRRGIERERFR